MAMMAWPPGMELSMVSSTRSMRIAGSRQVDQEQGRALARVLRHDDADARAVRAGDEGLAAVDHPVIAVQRGRGLHHRRIGAGAALRRPARS